MIVKVEDYLIDTEADPKVHSDLLGSCSKENGRIFTSFYYKGAHGLLTLEYNKKRKLKNIHFYSYNGYYTGCYGDNNLKCIVKKGIVVLWRRYFWDMWGFPKND